MSRPSVAWVVLLVLALGLAAQYVAALGTEYIEDADRFPGWRGELPIEAVAGETVGYGELGKASWAQLAAACRACAVPPVLAQRPPSPAAPARASPPPAALAGGLARQGGAGVVAAARLFVPQPPVR